MHDILIIIWDMIYLEHGNREEDCKKSNIQYYDDKKFNYEIKCEGCGQLIYRQRYNKNFTKQYRCGKCGGKFEVYRIMY